MKFKVGDKVKLLRDYTSIRGDLRFTTKDIFTIRAIDYDTSFLELKEVPKDRGWYISAFELVRSVEPKYKNFLDVLFSLGEKNGL